MARSTRVSAAANLGALVFGAGGRQVTYASPVRLIPGFEPQPAGSALEWLLRSYLPQYGPAAPRDFAQWIGSHPREQVFPGRAAQRALSRGQAGPFPVVLIDGVVGGVWHSKRSGRNVLITVEPLRRLTKPHLRQLEDEAEKVAAALEAKATLIVGQDTVGPHA